LPAPCWKAERAKKHPNFGLPTYAIVSAQAGRRLPQKQPKKARAHFCNKTARQLHAVKLQQG
jgi:hypothetical protein